MDGPCNAVHDLPRGLSQASCLIVIGFRAVLDLDTNPLSNLIRPRCAEEAKPGRGKPVLIIQNPHIIFHSLVALKRFVLLISRRVGYSARIVVDKQTDKQTHRPSTVTLAAHARRGLILHSPCCLCVGEEV